MPIRQAVRDLEKRLARCSVIRVFELPMEEKGRITASSPDPMEYCSQTTEISGHTAIQVLEAWTATMNLFIEGDLNHGEI